MEQVLVMNVGGMRTLDSQIGVYMDDSFFISDECLEALEEIQKGLISEDKNTRYFRRYCASYDIVRKNLLPLLLSLDEDINCDIEEKDAIFFNTIKVLAYMSQPLECLIPNLRIQLQTVEKFRNSESSQQIPYKLIELETLVQEIQAMLFQMKQAFTKPEPTQVILSKLTDMVHSVPEGKVSAELCDAIDDMFFLYRNFLYLSDSPLPTAYNSREFSLNTVILRLLFQFTVKDMVLYCVNSPQYEKWTLSIIEFITLMYKDPERTLCSTYQPSIGTDSDSSDSTLTDDYDSECFSQQAATGTEHSHAPTRMTDDSHGSTTTSKSLTTKDTIIFVREKLREFTYSLLENGYSKLLYAVKTLLVNDAAQPQTSMYYMWNLGFGLMMSLRFNVPFASVRELLSVYTVDYLIYMGAVNSEKLLIAQSKNEDCTGITRQIHLAVKGLTYVFKCLDFYWTSTDLTAEDRQYLINIQVMLVQQSDLRHLVLLLIRTYSQATHQLSYLKAVIKLNHAFLLMTERLLSVDSRHNYFDMKEHISNFATNHVMRQYGMLLTNYRFCSAQTVEQVFTMMHHVATDCERPQTLLQLPILNAFCVLEEGPCKQTLSQECTDLMEYSFQQYMKIAQCDPMQCAKVLLSYEEHSQDDSSNSASDTMDEDDNAKSAPPSERMDDTQTEPGQWTQAELDELCQICMEYEGCDDFENTVRRELESVGISKDLSQVDWSSLGVGNAGQPGAEDEYGLPRGIGQDDAAAYNSLLQLGLDKMDITELLTCPNKVTFYVEKLRNAGHESYVAWLQALLLETCYIRLGGFSLGRMYPEEPVQLIHILLRKSIPIVTYTEEQQVFVRNKYFKGLMIELGIETAIPDEQIYARIPHTWDVQHLIQKAQQLAPVDYTKTKFTPQDVKQYCDKMTSLYTSVPFKSVQLDTQNSVSECEKSMWMLYIGKVNNAQA